MLLNILPTTEELVKIRREREAIYGSSYTQNKAAGKVWEAMLEIYRTQHPEKTDIPPWLVALMTGTAKILRACTDPRKPHRDNYVDAINYILIAWDLLQEEKGE